jgi:protein-S-isoprenylcysteine O-methyltransferase Ste14
MFVVNLFVYATTIIMAVILVTLFISSIRMAAREKEFVRAHADEWNAYVKRMQAKGRWNDVK